jgi:hypothetical protein
MTHPPPLDYRRPGAMDASRQKSVRDHLRLREAMLAGKIFSLLVLGMPMLFVGPFLMACIFWFAAWHFMGSDAPAWTTWFWGLVMVMIPLLFWTEYRSRGSYFADAVISSGGASSVPYLAGPELGMLISFATNPRVAASGFVELFLVGPRFVLDAIAKLHGARRLRGANVDRAADIVVDLRRFDQGVPIHRLAREGETVDVILPSLAYLIFHDWVGISAAGDRVWLHSESKRILTS